GQFPAELFGDFVAVSFRAFSVVGAEIDVDQAPAELVGDLRAQAVDVVVVAVDADDAAAVNGGVQHFGGLEIRREEDGGVEALLRALGGNGIGEVAGRRATDGLEPEALRSRKRRGHYAILKGKRGIVHRVILKVEILYAQAVAEIARPDQRRPSDGL